jgi:hypothetical protein
MKKFLRFLVGRWFVSFIGALALAAIVWLLGPLLAFLEGEITRLIIVRPPWRARRRTRRSHSCASGSTKR